MDKLSILPPSIEPVASGHVIEQIQFIEKIMNAGFAYEKNGSVYFDVLKYNQKYPYGKLSGRVLDDLLSYTRELDGQQEKNNSFDFALWKKAGPEHIMRWPSKWGEGFPGWHLECSVMSTKYLGDVFDIHGGGMDLLFPHHECEMAQSTAVLGKETVKYWVHNNMITINGQKMGKSLNNFITLEELFSGSHKLLEKAYSPMTIRFFILQAHYRSTLDFSNEALQGSEKAFSRLMKAVQTLDKLKPSEKSSVNVNILENACEEAMNDDLNSPIAIASLFDGVRWINSIAEGTETISATDLEKLKSLYQTYVFDILGLIPETGSDNSNSLVGNLIDMILNIRTEVKSKKDFQTSDKIRDELTKLGVIVKDKKDGFEWEIK
jgi:cysteinyl-tRNA synthetase